MAGFATRVLRGLGDTFKAKAGAQVAAVVEALTAPAETVDTLLQPTTNGWPTALDLASTPQPRWLGQLAGVRVDTSLTVADQRAQILAHPMWKRGTPGAIRSLAQSLLTGTKRVDLFERDGGSAWALRVRVFTPQLANPATTAVDVKALLLHTKPIGIALTVEVFPGSTYADINAKEASYAALNTAVPNYNNMLTNTL